MIGLLLMLAAVTAQPVAPLVILTPPSTERRDPLAGMTVEGLAKVRAQMSADRARREAGRAKVTAAHQQLRKVMTARPMDLAALRAALDARDAAFDSNRRAQSAAAIELMNLLSESDRHIVARALLSDGDRPPAAR